ncbi:hypothetical protein [Micromonospora sagamiensis]|nr:hypothetical protein [Micromonospora sagamiensis]
MSPPLTDGDPGLTANDTGRWKLVWSASSYEPDPIIAGTYGLGALMSYDGYLYWGTMHVPMKSTSKIAEAYPPGDEVEARAVLEKSQRAVIFRGKRFGTLFEDVDLLYGEEKLPAYDATANNGGCLDERLHRAPPAARPHRLRQLHQLHLDHGGGADDCSSAPWTGVTSRRT